MKRLIVLYEAKMTEKTYKQLLKNGRKMALPTGPPDTINGKPMTIIGAGVAEENVLLDCVANSFRSKPHA